MVDTPRRPLLNPVLRFTKEPRPKSVNGGGKSYNSIIAGRLSEQRKILASQFLDLSRAVERRPRFHDKVVIYASMFEDSLAPSWTPADIFQDAYGARLITPYKMGYLVELASERLAAFARIVAQTGRTKELVDISRVEAVDFFDDDDVTNDRALDDLWNAAPQTEGGRAFVAWLMPLRDTGATEHLIQVFAALRERSIASPPPLLETLASRIDTDMPAPLRRGLMAAAGDGDRISLALRDYRRRGRARATVIVPSVQELGRVVASGAVFRIDPAQPIRTTSPGKGREPDRPLPEDMSSLPIVGVVDGGLNASSYRHAEAWRAPALVADAHADTRHGNQVTSLIVQGHDWNNNLTLPPLYCQVGTVQAVTKHNSRVFADPQDFITYLDAVMGAATNTRVWNFSLNQNEGCSLDMVSPLAHDIAMLARKHDVLPIISIGNKPGTYLQPPADCEAAITVGGRDHDDAGKPAGQCPVSLIGPGPSSMLKPDLSQFSRVRAIGGAIIQGSSFATALISPLAAHTMARLRDASPDLVKALLLHNADREAHDPSLGFGTPIAEPLPWECRPGFVTLQWTAALRPGAAFYWELPIPPSLRKTGKLKGMGALTAVLNPHPMVSDIAGPNYFSVRLETALQFERGITKTGDAKFNVTAHLVGRKATVGVRNLRTVLPASCLRAINSDHAQSVIASVS